MANVPVYGKIFKIFFETRYVASGIWVIPRVFIYWRGGQGAMVLGKLPVPGRPTNLDCSRARAYCACSRCGWGFLDIFLLSFISFFFLPLSGRRPDID